jgi:hypothetical protein
MGLHLLREIENLLLRSGEGDEVTDRATDKATDKAASSLERKPATKTNWLLRFSGGDKATDRATDLLLLCPTSFLSYSRSFSLMLDLSLASEFSHSCQSKRQSD